MAQLPFHPLADVFPLIEGREFDELVASIKENGQRQPIMLLDGAILDGRNRYRACQEVGIEPITKVFDGTDPVRFVIDVNVRRRHLNESQRALIAAKLTGLSVGRPHSKSPASEIVGIPTISQPPISLQQAGDMMNVHRSTVHCARKVLEEATPDEIKAVQDGKAAVSTIAKDLRSRPPTSERQRPASMDRQIGVHGRRLPQKSIDERMTRALEQLRNTAEIVAEFLASPEADGHPDSAAWLTQIREARSLLSTTINQIERRAA